MQHISGLAVVYNENHDDGTHPASTQRGAVETGFNKTTFIPLISVPNFGKPRFFASLRGSGRSTLCSRPVSAFR